MGTQWEVKRIRTYQHGLNEAQSIEKKAIEKATFLFEGLTKKRPLVQMVTKISLSIVTF